MSIAATIRDQIGSRALYMIGAKNLVATEKGLTFKIGRNGNGVTHVQIELDEGADLYDVTFLRIHGTKVTTKDETTGAYADMLRDLIERATGLAVTL